MTFHLVSLEDIVNYARINLGAHLNGLYFGRTYSKTGLTVNSYYWKTMDSQ